MALEQVSIKTKDGTCAAFVFAPPGAGPWPAVIFYMDGLGVCPALAQMAERLAGAGYLVLLPDTFCRFGTYEALDPKKVFAGDFRAIVGPMMATTDNHKAAADSEAFLGYLDGRSDVKASKIGTVGFCMGGGMAVAVAVAGAYLDGVTAAASYHGGNLATDAPTSPHPFASRMRAEIYVGGADNDGSYPPELAERLDATLSHAGVAHRCEIYRGAAHGWMMPDFPVFDQAASERSWREMLDLFQRNL